jgi:Cu/Ag efflux protein CusF
MAFLRWLLVTIALLVVVSTSASAAAQDVYTYEVKGVLKSLPGKGTADNEILVKHEPIPGYRDEAGNIVGMAAMTMPFYLAPSIKVESFEAGDRVEMVVEQRLKPRFTEEVISLKKVNK